MVHLAAEPPAPESAIEALHLFAVLTLVLLVFVVMVGVITARRRARLRRERIVSRATPLDDAWAESARRLAIGPSETRKGPRHMDDRDPPPHDDDPPGGRRPRPRNPR